MVPLDELPVSLDPNTYTRTPTPEPAGPTPGKPPPARPKLDVLALVPAA